MQNVAEITPPLKLKAGLPTRGSFSSNESALFLDAPVKLIRRRTSWLLFAPEAASLGECAILSALAGLCAK